MKNSKITLFAIALSLAVPSLGQSPPMMVNYQGRLSQISGLLFPNGPAEVRVKLWDAATAGSPVWDSGILTVQVRDGVFSALLEGGTPTLSNAQFIPGLRYFELSVKQGSTWSTLTPRQVITTVPWSFWAEKVPDGSIGPAQLTQNPSSLIKVSGGAMQVLNGAVGIGGNPSWKFEVIQAGPVAAGVYNSASLTRTWIDAQDSYGQFLVSPGKFLFLGESGSPTVTIRNNRVGVQNSNPLFTLDLTGTVRVAGDSIFQGNVGVLQSPSYPLDVNGTVRARGDLYVGPGRVVQGEGTLNVQSSNSSPLYLNPNSTGPVQIGLNSAPGLTVKGGIISEGRIETTDDSPRKPTGGGWIAASDARLKKNIRPIQSPLEQLLSLNGVSYEWRDPAARHLQEGRYYGFIAQQVAPRFPRWVSTGPDGYLQLGLPNDFSALTVESIRQLAEENKSLRQRVSGLEARLQRMEALLAK